MPDMPEYEAMKKRYLDHHQKSLQYHSQMLDHFRSIDDIVKEGSDPSSESRFKSSSGRTPDDGSSPLGGKAE